MTARDGLLPSIHFRGMLRSFASWAKVGRELVLALARQGVSITAEDIGFERYDRHYNLPLDLIGRIRQAPVGAIELSFEAPDHYSFVFRGPRRIGLLVWEATRWPGEWVRAVGSLERIIVPSAFCAESLARDGVPRTQIAIVPHGVDSSIYYPERSHWIPDAPARLLFVGTPAWRKGLDILLEAFEQTFAPGQGVELVLKVSDYADIAARPYLIHDWRQRCDRLRALGHRIITIDDPLTEPEMGELYRSADVLCLPFRGEGFAMPLLEAAACGTPSIITGWGAPLDYLDADSSWLVPVIREVPAAPLLPNLVQVPETARMVEPDSNVLAALLREALEDEVGRRRRSRIGALLAQRFTWDVAARRLLNSLDLDHGRPAAQRRGNACRG